jgi:hypothetical protein
MTDLLGQEIKTRIETYLKHPHLESIVSDPAALERIRADFSRKSSALRVKLGEVYADLETFHDMVFEPSFEIGVEARRTLVAVLIFFLNPFEFFPGGMPLLGLVDGRLVIACAAQTCSGEIDRFASTRK